VEVIEATTTLKHFERQTGLTNNDKLYALSPPKRKKLSPLKKANANAAAAERRKKAATKKMQEQHEKDSAVPISKGFN